MMRVAYLMFILTILMTGCGSSKKQAQNAIDSKAKDEPYFLVEVMPTFRGGDVKKFREWIRNKVIYPQSAVNNKIEGKVYVTFIIETDGSVSNVFVVKSLDPSIDKIVVEAIQSSPKWSPGLHRGSAVRVQFSMWLNFAI